MDPLLPLAALASHVEHPERVLNGRTMASFAHVEKVHGRGTKRHQPLREIDYSSKRESGSVLQYHPIIKSYCE